MIPLMRTSKHLLTPVFQSVKKPPSTSLLQFIQGNLFVTISSTKDFSLSLTPPSASQKIKICSIRIFSTSSQSLGEKTKNNDLDNQLLFAVKLAIQDLAITSEAPPPRFELIRDLLGNKADPNYQDSFTWDTALHLAARHNLIPIIELLLNHGANPKIKNKDGESALDIISDITSIKKGCRDVVKKWIDENKKSKVFKD